MSAFGLRAVGRYVAPVELLEAMAERRAAGKGTLSADDLRDLGMTIGEATALIAALKTTRARQPDRPGQTPKPVKDSPFAVLRALAAPLDPAARTKRRRPRRARSPTGGT
ncbi:MAG TPA: hypothetical protein DCX75_09035 [Brevundimonas sp.]|nr:hypothetical protein [Brevundimonas sp.]